jgi:hypothetical protein
MSSKVTESKSEVEALVRDLYRIAERLEAMFGRPFTPDGHLVGSLGEVMAARIYGLRLLPPSTRTHDAIAPDGRRVQVKATQATRAPLSELPEHLIVLQLSPRGESVEIYNRPGQPAWDAAGKRQKNGQRPISTGRLRKLMERVPGDEQVKRLET